ncbi:MAG: DnaJ domain-containing protein [Psittacicella sp.]
MVKEFFNYKTATRAELKFQYNMIASKTGDNQDSVKRELFELPNILDDKERVIAFVHGELEDKSVIIERIWLVVLTDQRIIFLYKPLMDKVKCISINLTDYDDMFSVKIDGQCGIFSGNIKFYWRDYMLKFKAISNKSIKPFILLANNRVKFWKGVYTAVRLDKLLGAENRLAILLNELCNNQEYNDDLDPIIELMGSVYVEYINSNKNDEILFSLIKHLTDIFSDELPHNYQSESNDYQESSNNSYQESSNISEVDLAYELLNVTKEDNRTIIKKAYKNLMNKYHPDKLVSQNLSDKELKEVTKKAQDIQNAYEIIYKSRGFD